MRMKDFSSKAVDAARNLGLLSYISKQEEFENEESFLKEALLRASTICSVAYDNGQQTYDELCSSIQEFQDFCETFGYDFEECCYNVAEYGIMSDRGAKTTGGLLI